MVRVVIVVDVVVLRLPGRSASIPWGRPLLGPVFHFFSFFFPEDTFGMCVVLLTCGCVQ